MGSMCGATKAEIGQWSYDPNRVDKRLERGPLDDCASGSVVPKPLALKAKSGAGESPASLGRIATVRTIYRASTPRHNGPTLVA